MDVGGDSHVCQERWGEGVLMSASWFSGVTITEEVGWASAPSTAIGSTSWTDESLRARGITARRGRSDVFDSFQPGTKTTELVNADRRFDPNHSGGALFGNLLPMRRARVKVTYNAVEYPLWSGFVDDLPQQYDIGGRDATVNLQCTDAFKVLSLLKLPESVYAVQLPLDTPTAWWRLGEQSGTEAIDSSGNGFDGTYFGGATFNSTAGLIFGGADSAIAFDGVDDYVQVPIAVTAFPVTLEAWFSCSLGQSVTIYDQESFDGATRLSFSVQSTGEVRTDSISGVAPAISVYTTITTAVVADGNAHHVAAVFTNGSTAATLYVDGVAQSTTTNTLNLPTSFPSVGVGLIQAALGSGVPIGGGEGTLDEIAIYGSALSAATIAAHYGYGTDPWAGDTSGERIGRLLDLVGVPSADRDIATGISTIQAQALANQPVLEALQAIADSEQGQLFMGADGKVVFRDRHWRFENTLAITSNATFGDSGSELRYSDIETDGGENLIFNRVRASRQGGATADAKDQTSITKFYERTDEVTGLQNESDLEVRDLANWRLNTHKNPIQRVTVLEIKPRKFDQASSLFPQVLARDIGHRVTVKRRPQGVGTALTYTCLIEGIEHTITREGEWTTRWYLSAADSQPAVQPLVFDDAVYGLFDTGVFAY